MATVTNTVAAAGGRHAACINWRINACYMYHIYTPAEFNYGSLTSRCFLKRGRSSGGSNLYCRADRVATMLRPTGNCILERAPGS